MDLIRLVARAGLLSPLIMLGFGQPVSAAPGTHVGKLRELNRVYAQRLEQRRTARYYELLSSTDPVAATLNQNPDIRLQYIDQRGMPVFYGVENTYTAITLSTNYVKPGAIFGFELDGSGTEVGSLGVWDAGGVRLTHQELTGRVVQVDSPSTTHYHSTHVSGTLVSQGVQFTAVGMSPAAMLAAYDWNSDEAEMAAAAAAGMKVSSHSYGTVSGWVFGYLVNVPTWFWFGDTTVSASEDHKFGFYDEEAAAWDEIAYNAPYYLIVKSAGNDRNDVGPAEGEPHVIFVNGKIVWSLAVREADGGSDGYDCIPTKGVAKNIMTVGAIEDLYGGWKNADSVHMTYFSSWGPTDDGRIKPDIVGSGSTVYSCSDGSDNDYEILSGTSMSTPSIAGSINLLVRYWERVHGVAPLASTMRAVVIQSADDAGTLGPDYQFGWGVMNTLSAARLIRADSVSGSQIIEDSVSGGDRAAFAFSCDGTKPVRLTLVWTDPPHAPAAPALNDRTPMLVHDLDLRVQDAGGGRYLPFVLDPDVPSAAAVTGDNRVDNVEQIRIQTPPAGEYYVSVRPKGILTAPQYFSLVSSEPLTAVECPQLAGGDANDDGVVSSADIIQLVAYTFKGGPAPMPCVAVGDVNCDGGVTSADVITLVNFVFKSGAPPCDLCSLIPGTWVCP